MLRSELYDATARLASRAAQRKSTAAEPPAGTPFTQHVSLTREIQVLREQVAALQAERRRYVADVADVTLVPARPGRGAPPVAPVVLGPLAPLVKPHGTVVLRRGASKPAGLSW